MGQITIYLDDELIGKVQEHASSLNVSKSQWIARLIKERTRTEWPESIKALAGSWSDFPEAEQLRAGLGNDIEREPL
ncbi:MAG: ribbon-helix-helix protein, CopG family [Thiolinea sp.]